MKLLAIALGLIISSATSASEDTSALAPPQQAIYDAAAKNFYYAQAVFNALNSDLNAIQLQLARQQKALEAAREKLKASCPGDIVDVDGKPAECHPKAAEKPKSGDQK
jgi:Skp family chaperone for outer membrane proteins